MIVELLPEARLELLDAVLCGELFRIVPSGIETATQSGTDAEHLATIKRIDIASIYDAQKTALQAYFQSVGDPVYVASYGVIGKKDGPDKARSWCAWTQGIQSLLPLTDTIAFVWNLQSDRKTLLVSRPDADRIVGHYYKTMSENPPRMRLTYAC